MSLKLDGRLPAAQGQLLEVHLDSCPACSQEWRRWQGIDELFCGAAMAQPREDLAERVMVRLQRRPQPNALGGSLVVMGLGLVVLAVVLVLPLMVPLCTTTMMAVQSPGMLATASSVAVELLEIGSTAVEVGRLLLWGLVNSRSLLAALLYAAVAVGTVAVWLRVVVFRKVPVPATAGLRA